MGDDTKFVKIELEMAQIKDAMKQQNETFDSHVKDEANAHKTHIELLQQVSDQMKETQECFTKLDKKLDLNIQKMNYELKAINKLDEKQNQLIDEHIEGVKTLKDIYEFQKKENEDRFQKIEEPRKVFKTIIKWILSAGGVAGAIYTIGKVMGKF